MLIVNTIGNKGTAAFCIYPPCKQFVGFIYGIRLVVSCQIQDDLSLYYNMVAANGKDMDPNARKSLQIQEETMQSQGHQHTSCR